MCMVGLQQVSMLIVFHPIVLTLIQAQIPLAALTIIQKNLLVKEVQKQIHFSGTAPTIYQFCISTCTSLHYHVFN